MAAFFPALVGVFVGSLAPWLFMVSRDDGVSVILGLLTGTALASAGILVWRDRARKSSAVQ